MEVTVTCKTVLHENFLNPYQIPSKLRVLLTTDLNERQKAAIQTEIKCFEFRMQNGKLVPSNERIDAKGSPCCYPDHSTFTTEEWDYITQRLDEEAHPFLKSRYAHLLWTAKKHNKFAHAAINAYQELSNLYFQEALKQEKLFRWFCEVVKCYHQITSSTKYKVDDCKTWLLKWLSHNKLPFFYKETIVTIIIDSPLFKAQDYQGLTNMMLSYLEAESYGYTARKRFLETLQPLAQKEKLSQKVILNLLGENEMTLASDRQSDQTGMVPFMCYQRAAHYFKLAGETNKHEQAAQLYASQKHKIKLGVITTEMSDENVQLYNQILNDLVDNLFSGEPYRPFLFLATNGDILLPKEVGVEEIKKQRQNSLTGLFTINVFDQNNNGKVLTEDEKLQHHQFQHYSLYLQMFTLQLMGKLFFQGIRTGGISKQTFMSFFQQSWLGQPLNGYTVDGETQPFSWMEMLGPGLYEIINELNAEVHDHSYKASYVLPIDSLSIKMEGVVRDYARLAGVSVSKIGEGEALEMNLEELLSEKNEKLLALFQADDVLLWKTVLTRKGWNIRNNTAHAFYLSEDYSRQKVFLLLLCLYRIAGYKINITE